MKRTMKMRYCVLLLSLICCVYLSSTKTAEAAGSGTCFGFPTLDSSLSVSVQANDIVTIPFHFKSNCLNCSKGRCKIYVTQPAKPTGNVFCIFMLEGDNCTSFAQYSNCQCNTTSGLNMILTKTVTRGDMGEWLWTAQGHTADQRHIFFNDLSKLSTIRERPTHTRDSPGSITPANDGTMITEFVNSITRWETPNHTSIKDNKPVDEHSINMAVAATAANAFAVVAIACTIFVCWRSRTKKRREASVFATSTDGHEANDTMELQRRHDENVTHDARPGTAVDGRSTSWDFEKMTFNSQHV